jgi:GH43 family beta-xylosidase
MAESQPLKPLIRQRADPCIRRHSDGWYYFTASVPDYDRIELRRARSIIGLVEAERVDVWRKPAIGPLSELVWAPEIHHGFGAWQIYFAAAPSRAIKDDLFQHRMYVISNPAENPHEGVWSEPVRVETGIDSFCLDATTFPHRGVTYYVWAQKHPQIDGNSNLYIARMKSAAELASVPVQLSVPDQAWERRGFSVNEGPSVIVRHGRVFLTYSASATDENYCMGLLQASEEADLLDPASWSKSTAPVFTSDPEYRIFGPGHNSFTQSEDGETDLLVYHARTYTKIVGDPLWDPNRHTYVKALRWDSAGQPIFGRASGVER